MPSTLDQGSGILGVKMGYPAHGFFCNGEISYNRVYGYTGVLSLFL